MKNDLFLFAPEIFWTVIGSTIFLIGFSIVNIVFLQKKDHKAVVFKTEKGEVKIALSAIEDYIKRLALGIKEIKDIKSKISVSSKRLKIVSKAVLQTDVGVADIVKNVQEDIEHNVKNMLGIDMKVDVNVNVIRMLKSKDLPKTPEKQTSERQDSSFQGIEY